MAIVSSQEATTYDVFLSFRGKDTRTKFTDHLYTAMIDAGFRTFRDNEGIARGDNIASELQRAIRQSRISLVVLSKSYAASKWCLDELVLILKCKRTLGRHVLPLFYDVDPSHVRKHFGGFAEAFKVHENDARKSEWTEKLEGWNAALKEVSNLGGMVLRSEADGHESEFIKKVVKVVQQKLSRTALNVASYLIGVKARVISIHMWLHDWSTKVGILAIYGMGGIGKTTIAKFLYNLNFERFDGSSFLANVREYSEQSDGLVRLQRQLLSDILRGRTEKIRNIDEGIIKIREALCSKRVLLVVDDVDQRDQLDAILGMQDWFYPGSKVILTTRNERLLKAHEVYEVYQVEKLNHDESLELFSWHAFGQNHPIDGFTDQSTRVVSYCGGLPLALQVLGSSLSGTSVDIWESAIQKLENIADNQVLKKLIISYNGLQDSHDKNLFLDIACFLVGEDKDNVITILDSCGYYTKVGLQNLIDRCLLTIDQDNKVTMHQLLRELGREIIRQESPQEPEKRSRLCHHKDCIKVLSEKTGTETLEGLSLKNQAGTLLRSNGGKRDRSSLSNEENSSKRSRLGIFSLLWTGLSFSPTETFLSLDKVDFETNAFTKMRKLRLLQLKNVRLTGDYKYLPRELRWLCWHGFSLKYIPDTFPLENLICLDMQHSSLKQVWKRQKLLGLLKILNLSYSPLLEITPDFSVVPNLESLCLRYCIKLVEIHKSIGELRRLLSLNLEGCKNLQKLPTNIGNLKSLEKLVLSGCSKLNDFPFDDFQKMEYLTVFHADGTSICQPPAKSEETNSPGSIFWPWISKLGKPSEPVVFSLSSFCRSLVNLSLANCGLTDDALPTDLGCLSSLKTLYLSGNQICSLPESIKNLTTLQELGLNGCTGLQSLPLLPSSIKNLNLEDCKSLEAVRILSNKLSLCIYNCEKLVEAQGIFKLVPIQEFDADIIEQFAMVNLESMANMEVRLFSKMTITERKVPLQVLCEIGIYSIYLPGSEVPPWFSSYKTSGSSLCFDVPSVLPNTKIKGLNICVIYTMSNKDFDSSRNDKNLSIAVRNYSKNVKRCYGPTFIGLPDEDQKDMTWLSQWKLDEKMVESGNEVNISVYIQDDMMQLKELGVHFVYKKEEEEEDDDDESTDEKYSIVHTQSPGGGRENKSIWCDFSFLENRHSSNPLM